MAEDYLTIDYSVEKVIYRNIETGFAVLRGSVNEVMEIAVGELANVQEGEDWSLTGTYVEHPSYGMQFRVKVAQRKLPVTAKAIEKFLASGEIKGIGSSLAKKIVNQFGDQTLIKIEQNPGCLTQIKGISKNKVEKIYKEFEKLFAMRKLILFLEGYGIDPTDSVKLYSKMGTFSMELVKKNPFILCDSDIGVCFAKADDMASKLEIKNNSKERIQTGIEYILKHNALENGHTCIPRDILIPVACKLLNLDRDEIDIEIDDMLKIGRIRNIKINKEYIFLPSYYMSEEYTAKRLIALLQTQSIDEEVIEKLIDLEEQRMKIGFVPLQRKAIREAISNGIFVLTGGPGTGKTTILNAVISILEQKGLNMSVCAPTGRAAKRLNELTDKDALTIHRLLGVQTRENGVREFIHNEHNKLDCEVIIIDEMSMVDNLLFYNLLKALDDNCSIILTGDANQLPSVSAGNILRELISSDLIPMVCLKDIFRQSAQSLIVTNAHDIINGELPEIKRTDSDFFFMPRGDVNNIADTTVKLVSERLPKSYNYSPIDDIQVICPSKKGVIGTSNLNNLIQDVVNPHHPQKQEYKYGSYIFREGDKVMQIKNNYDIEWIEGDNEGSGIFNGDIGIITKINKNMSRIIINFDSKEAIYTFDLLKQLELSYAITIHKSQGNEFKSVVMPLLCKSSEFYNRNLLYTGITRAKEMIVVVGSAQSIAQMTNQIRINYRYTNLKEFLKIQSNIE